MGALFVAIGDERVELTLESREGTGWALGLELFLEALVEALDLAAGLGMRSTLIEPASGWLPENLPQM
jgi:hypothetical protein